MEPFEWETPDGAVAIKSSTLRVSVSPREAARVMRAPESPGFSRIHLALDYSIVTTRATPEPIYIPELEIVFRQNPDPTVVFTGRSEGFTIVLPDELGVVRIHDFEVTMDLDDTISLEEIVPVLPGGPTRVDTDRSSSGTGYSDGEIVPLRVRALRIRASLHDGGILPGPGLRHEIDQRREGLGEILPVGELRFTTLRVEASRQQVPDATDQRSRLVFDIAGTDFEGPDLRAGAQGTVSLAADAGLYALDVRITVDYLADSLRPAVVPLIYTVTGGAMIPRNGPFTLTADIHRERSPGIALE